MSLATLLRSRQPSEVSLRATARACAAMDRVVATLDHLRAAADARRAAWDAQVSILRHQGVSLREAGEVATLS